MRLRGIVTATLALVLAGAATPARAAGPLVPVAAGFQDEAVLEDLESPTAVRFAPPPDGRVFVAHKDGTVTAYDDLEDTQPQLVLDLRTDTHDFWDRGLLGMAVDPDWATRPYLYLLYTRDAKIGGGSPEWRDGCGEIADAGCEASARLVRVRIDELGVAGPVEPVIEDEWCQQYPVHSIGTVVFGPDGMLYAGAGDAANFEQADYGQLPDSGDAPPNPCGDPPQEGGMLRAQDVRTPGDPTGLDGAIVRVDPDTGAGAPGNPFADSPDPGARRIVAYGLRNPFRFTFRPGTDELWIGDVGWTDWEEIDRIPDATDAVAENFGWPCYEGDAPQWWLDSLDLPLCTGLEPSDVTPPVLAYRHGATSVPAGGDGCDLSPGASIAGVAFAPSGYPPEYEGGLFVGEFAAGCLFALRAGEDGAPDPDAFELFARREEGGGGPVEVQAGPDGALYYTLFDPGDPSRGSLRRIVYRPDNQVPVAHVTATPAEGPVPLTVAFSAAASTDPDGDALTYAWDLDGDGQFDDATGVSAAYTYKTPGDVRARVRVTDEHAASDIDGVTISADNTAPWPVIEAPTAGSQWAAGDTIAFRGSALDGEDGNVAASGLDWVITLEHCIQGGGCHSHPLEQRHDVASGTFTAPEHPYPTRLMIKLVATDSRGLSRETSIRLDQRAPGLPAATTPAPTAGAPAGGAPGPGPAPRGEPLTVRLSGTTRRRLARHVSLSVRCSRHCALAPRAELRTRGRPKRLPKPRIVALKGRTRLVVRLPAAARARARSALRRGRRARVRIVVTARDDAGATASARRVVRLIRRR